MLHISTVQGQPHPNADPDLAPPKKYEPIVDELKRPVTHYTTQSATTTKIALLHYRVKSKEVRGVYGPWQLYTYCAQDFEGKRARGYINVAHTKELDNLLAHTDDRATKDCTLPEVPDTAVLSSAAS